MSDTSISTADELTNRQVARRERSEPGKVTGRLKRALDLMVWDGITDNKAAAQTKMTVTAIRIAMQRPEVRKYLQAQREVLRARELGRNFRTLLQVRDQKRNAMARIKAVQAIEQTDETTSAARGLTPGFVVQILNVQAPSANAALAHNPTKPEA